LYAVSKSNSTNPYFIYRYLVAKKKKATSPHHLLTYTNDISVHYMADKNDERAKS
jgi:hypothetical protein